MKVLLLSLCLFFIFSTNSTATEWQLEEILDHQGIGSDCDIAIDNAGGLHVSFEYKHGFLGSSSVQHAFKANEESAWDLETVGYDNGGYTGYDNEIELDSAERPRIVYVYDIDWEYVPYLKHAEFDGSNWQIVQLTDWTESVEGPVSIAIDNSDFSHLFYGDWYGAGTMNHRWQSETAWQHEVIDTGNCKSVHAGIDVDGDLHIAYFKYDLGALRYGFHNGTSWNLETVDVDSGIYYNSGFDMAFDADGYPHLAYRGSDRELRHAWHNGVAWQIEVINSNALGYASIAIDSADGIHICYSVYTEASNRPLTYSYKGGSGWISEEIASDVQCWNTAMDIDLADQPHIIFYNYSGGITSHAWPSDPTAVSAADWDGHFQLEAPHPNPSSGSVRLAFELPREAHTSLELFDIQGRSVRNLSKGIFSKGYHSIEARGLPSGVYLCRLKTGGRTLSRKLVVLPTSK